MKQAFELIRTVEEQGGHFRVEGGFLVISPEEAALSVLELLREHKHEIIAVLTSGRSAGNPEDRASAFFDGPTARDFRAWAEDFHRWTLDQCVWRPRDFGRIGALCADFGCWALEHDSAPCQRTTFEALLADAGFLFADGMVSGLILKADLLGG